VVYSIVQFVNVINGWKIKCDNTQCIFMCCLTDVVGRTGSLTGRYVRLG
jgi:hypothetical protein